jgi:hypothetical protein
MIVKVFIGDIQGCCNVGLMRNAPLKRQEKRKLAPPDRRTPIEPPPNTKFDDTEQMEVLNMLGLQGWEAISSSRNRGTYGASTTDMLVKVLMKRERPQTYSQTSIRSLVCSLILVGLSSILCYGIKINSDDRELS